MNPLQRLQWNARIPHMVSIVTSGLGHGGDFTHERRIVLGGVAEHL